jgi:hypothetical protein
MKELTLKDIKVGGKYKVKPEYKDECETGNNYDFDYIKITAIQEGDLHYDIIKDGEIVGWCFFCYKPKHLEPLTPTCFEELREGDKVVGNDGKEAKVLFGNGLVVIVEASNGVTNVYSKKEFRDYGFTIPNAEPELDTATKEAIKLLKEQGYKIIKE